jgi:hypothetical protein
VSNKEKLPSFKYMLAKARQNRGFVKYGGNITHQDLEKLYASQDGICPVTGVKLIVPTFSNYKVNSLYRASIDRIDNSVGYFRNNIRFVSQMYNFAKNTNSDQNVQDFCRLVISRLENEKET